MSRQCYVDMNLSCASCSGTVCSGIFPPHPRRLFLGKMANVTHSFLSWPWLTGLWCRVKQGAEKLRSEKFFPFKCKEGDYINLNLGVEYHVNAVFSDPGSGHDHCPWVTRETNLSWEERKQGTGGELIIGSKNIKFGPWRERDQPPQRPITDPANESSTMSSINIMPTSGSKTARSGSHQVSEAIFMQVLTTFSNISKERNMVAYLGCLFFLPSQNKRMRYAK